MDWIRNGEPPDNRVVLSRITTGTQGLTGFLERRYLVEYIAQGGSKIKFVTGKTGSGKTHFLRGLCNIAEDMGFTAVRFSARDIWLHDFKEIYSEIFLQGKLMNALGKCAEAVMTELGHDPALVPAGMAFVDYLSSIGELDALVKKEIRNQLREMFLKNPLIDNNFAIACSLLTGGILGHPMLEPSSSELILAWLSGAKDIKLGALRGLGLSPAKITKVYARHMLRSLAEVHRIAGWPGIVVAIDDVDMLVKSSTLDAIRYTKLRREDAYESIRELIDEVDTLRNIMFFFAFDRILIDDELGGLKSYQALWMRIQNEVVGSRFNHFADIIDLDRYIAENFTAHTVVELSAKIAGFLENGSDCMDVSTAKRLLDEAPFSNVSLPRRVVLATAFGGIEASMEGGAGYGL